MCCLGAGSKALLELLVRGYKKAGAEVRGCQQVEGSRASLLLQVSWDHSNHTLAPQCYCPGLSSLAAPVGDSSDLGPPTSPSWGHRAIFTTLLPPLSWALQGHFMCCHCLFRSLLPFYPASIFWMIREMQIIIMWYHCTCVRMAKIQNSDKTKC